MSMRIRCPGFDRTKPPRPVPFFPGEMTQKCEGRLEIRHEHTRALNAYLAQCDSCGGYWSVGIITWISARETGGRRALATRRVYPAAGG